MDIFYSADGSYPFRDRSFFLSSFLMRTDEPLPPICEGVENKALLGLSSVGKPSI